MQRARSEAENGRIELDLSAKGRQRLDRMAACYRELRKIGSHCEHVDAQLRELEDRARELQRFVSDERESVRALRKAATV